MSVGAIHENETAMDYRYYIGNYSTHSDDDGQFLSVNDTWLLRCGKPYAASASGIKFTLYQSYVAGVGSRTIELHTPNGTYSYTSPSWDGTLEYSLEIDDQYLNVSHCDYEYGYSALRLYLSGSLVYSEGSHTESGTDYDRRLNSVYVEVDADTIPLVVMGCEYIAPVFTWAQCGYTYDTYPLYHHQCEILIETYWEYYSSGAWHKDEVEIKEYALGNCDDCNGDDPYTEVIDTYKARIRATMEGQKTKELKETSTCYCDDGYQTLQYFEVHEYTKKRGGSLNIEPVGSGLLWDVETNMFDCSGTTTTSEDNNIEIKTYIELDIYSIHVDETTPCAWMIAQEGCGGSPAYAMPVGIPIDPYPCIHPAHYITVCCSLKEYSLLWDALDCFPYKPKDCIHANETNEYWAAYINEDNGDLYILYSNFSYPLEPFVTTTRVTNTGDIEDVSMMFDSGYLYVAYNRTGIAGLKYRISLDQSRSWTGESTLFSGTTLHNRATCNTEHYKAFFASKYVSGSSGPVHIWVIQNKPDGTYTSATKIKDETGTDMQFEPEAFDASYSGDTHNSLELFAKLSGATNPNHFVSFDDGLSFKLVY